MFVFISRSGHPQVNGKATRPTLVAASFPQEIYGHLPGLLFGGLAKKYSVKQIQPEKVLSQDYYEAGTKREAQSQSPRILQEIKYVEEAFHNLACNPILRDVRIFGVVAQKPSEPFEYKISAASIPSDYWFLFQRIDRLAQERGTTAVLFIDESMPEVSEEDFSPRFSQFIYNAQDQKKLTSISPSLHVANTRNEAGFVIAQLVACVLRLTHEHGFGWEGSFNQKRRFLPDLMEEPFLQALNTYYAIIHAKTQDWLTGQRLYGIYLMSADKFLSPSH